MSRKTKDEIRPVKDLTEKDEKPRVADEMNNEGEEKIDKAEAGSEVNQEEESNNTPTSYDAELEESKDRLIRLQAEFLNYKRRIEKEKADIYTFGCEELAKDLLPIIDNLERALNTLKNKDDSVYQGIDMIKNQLFQVMTKHEITEIEAVGQPFDMNLHHAVMTEPCKDKEQENTVAEVMQKGYKLKNRVLRPSMVKVFQS